MGGILGTPLVKLKGVTKMVGTIAGEMLLSVAALTGVQLHRCSVLAVAATVQVAVPSPVVIGIDSRGVAFRGVAFPPNFYTL